MSLNDPIAELRLVEEMDPRQEPLHSLLGEAGYPLIIHSFTVSKSLCQLSRERVVQNGITLSKYLDFQAYYELKLVKIL